MAEVCDFVHALMLDRVERLVLADRTGVLVALAMGAEGDLPDVDEAAVAFEAALTADPAGGAVAESEEMELLRAIGLR